MNKYYFKAFRGNEKIFESNMFAYSVAEVMQNLKYEGYTPIVIKKKISLLKGFSNKIKPEEKINFIENIKILLLGGISIQKALASIYLETNNKGLKKIVQKITYDLNIGVGFSQAMSIHKKYFGEYMINVINIGESSGNLLFSLEKLLEFEKFNLDFNRSFKSELISPFVTLAVILLAIGFWSFSIIPQLIELLESFEAELPKYSLLVVAGIYFIKDNFILIAVFTFIPVIAHIIFIKKSIKYSHKFYSFLNTIMVGKLLQYRFTTRVASDLHVMTGSGMTVIESLAIIESHLKSLYHKETIKITREKIIFGLNISDSFRFSGAFPSFVTEILKTGEYSSGISEELIYLRDFYNTKLSHAMTTVLNSIQPLMLVFLGGLMIILIISFILPLYSFIGELASSAI